MNNPLVVYHFLSVLLFHNFAFAHPLFSTVTAITSFKQRGRRNLMCLVVLLPKAIPVLTLLKYHLRDDVDIKLYCEFMRTE
jgi:hypothetical protein